MRFTLLLIACVVSVVRQAEAQPTPDSGPIRVAIECQDGGRTKACPSFLAGLVDAHEVLQNAPRAVADVVVYVTANEIALVDRLHLRFVGRMTGAPPPVELEVDLDTRASDEVQTAALSPAFLRGVALFVAVRHPSAVAVALSRPAAMVAGSVSSSPWGLQFGINANGNYTAKYRAASMEVHLVGRYLTRRFRAFTLQSLSGGLNRQPALTLEDGTRVSLDSEQWQYRFGAEAVYSWNDHWSIGAGSYTFFEDPKAQYKFNARNRVAIGWDAYRADDPRGNRLGVFYHLGWMVERYNIRNDRGERFAQYPSHGINAVGSVRKDQLSFGLNLSSDAQVNAPGRRLLLTASPFATIQLGDHVDLDLSFSITKRTFPAPDPSAIDPSDFEQLSRLSYAEPLSLSGFLGLRFHWDPTNGVRNDRIETI